ncbi:SMP-30/gluconolactonase/LRE family protein [Larkinella knui]|uniref:SMP-30/gluconolactonase/LRE family protein n=1 Tax=Larkinella knui TaxID=2025310 RepID=A0A3P1CHK8_9BACT|nr:SMP-30/gluconolactonase/LRE family protein [Larkinella knui]RRB12822.1 SMP-30/gluconolactonase/LRE family protein [Larkinella knui]
MKNITIIATGLQFPEGPAFTSDGTLWCVEQDGASLFWLKPDGTTGRIQVGIGSRPNGLYIDDLDRLWFCDSGQHAIRCINYADQEPETIVDHVGEEPLDWPNDLIFDPEGNLIFTCPGPSEEDEPGFVSVCSTVGEVKKISEKLFYPNGVAFLPNGRTLLVSETHRKRIWAGRWDAVGLNWINPTVWAETGPNGFGPDGLTLGPDNQIYVAIYGGSCIQVYKPTGVLSDTIKLPGENPTNCAFDPTGRLGLVVTEGEKGQLLSIQL